MALLILIICLLFSCTDYVGQAEEYYEENYNPILNLSADSLRSKLSKSEAHLDIYIGDPDAKKEGALHSIYFKWQFEKEPPLDELTLFARRPNGEWEQRGTFNGENKWTLEWNSAGVLTATNSDSYYETFAIGIKQADTLGISLVQWDFTEIYAKTLHRLTSSAAPDWTEWEQSLQDAAIKSIQGAADHLGFALEGNHQAHLKHVYMYLLGKKDSDAQLLAEPGRPTIDTVGAIGQLDFLITQFVQLERSSSWDAEQELKQELIIEKLTEMKAELFALSEHLLDWSKQDFTEVETQIDESKGTLEEMLSPETEGFGLKDLGVGMLPLFLNHIQF